MKVDSITLNEVVKAKGIIKPNYHLNHGKICVLKAGLNGLKFTTLDQVTSAVYTGGIFKRVFIDEAANGLPYISAQHMMLVNPKKNSKIISKRYTVRQDDMMLKENQILVSCAGTIGNIRLITEDLEGLIGSQDIIRVIPNESKMLPGFLYAYLSCDIAYNYIQSFIYGSVVPRIEPATLKQLPIPVLKRNFEINVDNLITKAKHFRVESNKLLSQANEILFQKTGLKQLSKEDFEYFGNHNYKREVSTFTVSRNNLSSISINAFNYSLRIRKIVDYIKSTNRVITLKEAVGENQLFSTGSFPRFEIDSPKSIKLNNASC